MNNKNFNIDEFVNELTESRVDFSLPEYITTIAILNLK